MENTEFKDKLVSINRITKVVKGGRRFAFSALVVVGNYAGSIGVGHGKAKQVPDAIKKATQTAKSNLIKIPLREGRTLHHDILSKDGAGKVLLRLFFAVSVAFLIASGTCFAFPWPIPIEPFWLPTTTSAEKANLLPPFTTFVILFIDTSLSLKSVLFINLN